MADNLQSDDLLTQKIVPQQIDLIAAGLDSLPTPPAVLRRVLELSAAAEARGSASGDGAGAELLAVLACDPAVTARLLAMANQLPQAEVFSVPEAAGKLSSEAVLSAALSVAVPALSAPAPATVGEQDGGAEGLWLHCLAVACAARRIAQAGELPVDAEHAFACGLLHDVGKLAFRSTLPKSYLRAFQQARRGGASAAQIERQVIGVDHTLLGRRLAQRWRLPQAMLNVIWLHHQRLDSVSLSPAERTLVGLVGVADAVARRLELGLSGNFATTPSPEELAAQAGIAVNLADLAEQLPGEVQRLGRLAGLGDSPRRAEADAATCQALSQLLRLNDRLRRDSAAVTTEARAFRHLEQFTAGLTPDAAVPDVLERIAAMLRQVVGPPAPGAFPLAAASAVAAYSIDIEAEALLTVCVEGQPCRLLAARVPPVGQRALAGQNLRAGQSPPPVGSAAEAMAEILQEPSDLAGLIDLTGASHRPLVCAGSWIGGLIYPAGRGADEILDPIAPSAALALAGVRQRTRSAHLTDQLAAESQRLLAAQESLAQARTLAAVGEMASGAAHEINNPLAVISGRAQLMRDKAGDEAQKKVWQLIADQAQRISSIISDLMEFASPPRPTPEYLDLRGLLAEAVESFKNSNHPQAAAARADIERQESVPPLRADAGQIRWVVQELLSNAATASPGGAIRLGASADPDGASVLLTVADQGPGMDSPTLAGAFTPFFSRQRAGRRAGMGLARARRYVEINGGRMWIASQPGRGTTVYVQLPAAPEAPRP